MINLPESEWESLFDRAEETIKQAIADLPEKVRLAAEEVDCSLDRYTHKENWHILGIYMKWTNGPIIIYVGQIYEDCHQDIEAAMISVRQVYYHELAHVVGDLAEYEVKERGL
jgi:hypothetical protein